MMQSGMRQAFVGAGANLGDRAATLAAATTTLRQHPGIAFVHASSVYESDAVGLTDQPRFLNQVLGVETSLAPEELLCVLVKVENLFGRVRTVRWGPRTLDLDLLLFEEEARSSDRLTLPHPRIWERAFVTVPLQDVFAEPRFHRPCWDQVRGRLSQARLLDGLTVFSPP
jgi:2-amino-4-hydroxy-6-hydroxymethyldihydropteridine diphosphokinase